MKKSISSLLSIIFLFVTGVTLAQTEFPVEAEYAFDEEFGVSTEASDLPTANEGLDILNLEDASYENSDLDENIEDLDEVQGPNTPNSIRKHQVMASLYDVTDSYIFDGRYEPFEVVFNTEKGVIVTKYDWQGEVLRSEETFRNVALPNKIVRKALEGREGWRIIRTNYYVSYAKGRDADKVYTVQITNGKKRKKISLDAEGTIL